MDKIVVLGGHGTLGKELQKNDATLICPPRGVVDIHCKSDIREYVKTHAPNVIINAAAVIDNRVLEGSPEDAIQTNIIGAANVAQVCIENNIRLVYISTDYIYKGDRGNYRETDEIYPFNFYAWTKLGGECAARGVKNHLIIRCSFGKSEFSYSHAFSDKWASKDYVDVLAPMILEAAKSPLTGVLNLGTERKTLFDHARERNAQVKPVKISETSFFTPYDTSLNLQKWQDYKSEKPVAKPHKKCRVCGSEEMLKYLDLGLMPLANNLEITSLRAKAVDRYPLQLMVCRSCHFNQLSLVVNPEKLFKYYTYRSGINQGYFEHCKQMANDILKKYSSPKGVFHIDIAGNDGTLLKAFKRTSAWEYKCLNVDPAENLCAIAEHEGIPSLVDFWGTAIVDKILDNYGQADLITATNVFAHVDDIKDFLIAARNVLKPDGVLVIECPHVVDFIEKAEFDTIYFEHLSYVGLGPVMELCDKLGLKVIDAEKFPIHGGTIRITISRYEAKRPISVNVYNINNLEGDTGMRTLQTYMQWSSRIMSSISYLRNNLLDLKRNGAKIAGYGASAKGNTLLNSAGINTDIIDYIIDSTPEKIGKYSPGTGIAIRHPQELQKNPPDYLILLAWNFKDALIDNTRKLGYKGKFIIPVPKFEIV